MKEELVEGCLSDDCIPVPYRLLVPLAMESTSQSGRKDHFAYHLSMFETVALSHRRRGTMDTESLGRGLPQAQNGTCEK